VRGEGDAPPLISYEDPPLREFGRFFTSKALEKPSKLQLRLNPNIQDKFPILLPSRSQLKSVAATASEVMTNDLSLVLFSSNSSSKGC
jgi:hypothetical protein